MTDDSQFQACAALLQQRFEMQLLFGESRPLAAVDTISIEDSQSKRRKMQQRPADSDHQSCALVAAMCFIKGRRD